MPRTPQFLQPLTFDDQGDSITLDLTERMAAIAVDYPARFRSYLQGEPPILADFSGQLDERRYQLAVERRMKAPGFTENLRDFANAAGLPENAAIFRRHMHRISNARLACRSAQVLLQTTANGSENMDAKFETLLTIPNSDHFVSEISEYFDDAGYDNFVKLVPHPGRSDEGELVAWESRFRAWQKDNVIPFLHGTTPIAFQALTAGDLLAALQDDPETRLADAFEHWLDEELERHFEDAEDFLVRPDDTAARLRAWETKKLAGSDGYLPEDTKTDAELEEILAEFNAAQTIVSYMERPGCLVLREDATHQDCIDWAQRNLARAERDLQEALESFTPETADTPAF